MAANEVSVEITVEEKQALKALTALTKKVDKFGKDATADVKKIDRAFASFAGNLASVAATKALAAIGAGFSDGVKLASDFEKAILEINTILPKNTKVTKTQVQALRDLSKQYGTTAQAQAKSYYQIISAGTTDAVAATELLKQSNRLAIGGLSDTASSIDILTSAINAYGAENLSAEQASDALFTAVRLGKTTVSELSASLALAIPSAKAAGVNIDLLSASVATLTTKGFSTSVAVTRVNGLLTALAKNGDKLGKGFDITAVKTDGLVAVLKRLELRTGGNSEELLKLLGRQEAVQGAQTLMNNGASDLIRTYADFNNKAGATSKAFNQIKESSSFKFDQLNAQIDDLKISLGNILLPQLLAVGRTIATVFKADRPKTELTKIARELQKVREELNFKKQLRDGDGVLAVLTSFIRPRKNELELLKKIEQKEKRLLELRALRTKELQKRSGASAPSGGQDSSPVDSGLTAEQTAAIEREKTKNLLLIEERNKLNLELDLINQTKLARESEEELAKTSLGLEAREVAFNSLIEHETKKAEIVEALTNQKNKTIEDLDSRKIAAAKASSQKELDLAIATAKAKKVISDQEIRDKNVFFSKAISLSNSKNKELAAIGKAAGLIQIAQATPPAIASSFNFGSRIGGPVLGGVFAGIAAAAQAEQAIKMASFANGGVVGGFSGTTNGTDNTTANVRTGEMILNANEQRRLFDISQGKVNSGSGDSKMLELTVITQIDEREIARSVRNQRLEGYQI